MKSRKLPHVLLATLVALSPVPGLAPGRALAAPAVAAPAPEPVMIGNYYLQPSVDLLKRLGIITGDPDGRMRLGEPITRAELAKIAVAASGQTPAANQATNGPLAFPDLKGHWARGYIAVARKLGIVSGYEDGTFRPGNPVTHAEALTMLMRTAGLRPSGPWPAAFTSAARAAGILPDALAQALPNGDKAMRGAVFLLADRCFTLPVDGQGHNLLQRVYDLVPPGILVDAQGVTGGVTSADRVTLVITAPGALLLQVNGLPVWPVGGLFTATVNLQMGQNAVSIIAVDELGNLATQKLTIQRN